MEDGCSGRVMCALIIGYEYKVMSRLPGNIKGGGGGFKKDSSTNGVVTWC